jgi:hypothetical protein
LVSWRGALRRFSLGNFIKNRKRFCDSIEISTKDVANVLTQNVTVSRKKMISITGGKPDASSALEVQEA